MPAFHSLTPTETERHEPSYGGRPPFDDDPEDHGGGGGGDDDAWSSRRGPRDLLYKTRFYLTCALLADLILFAVLALLFLMHEIELKASASAALSAWPPAMLLLAFSALCLLLGCVAMELARRNIFREIDALEEWLGLGRPALRRTLPWLAAALALGAGFLAVQWSLWRHLAAEGGLSASRLLAPLYDSLLLMARAYALHLGAGLLALSLSLFLLGRLRRVELRQIAVDAAAWCWHFLALSWSMILFVVLKG